MEEKGPKQPKKVALADQLPPVISEKPFLKVVEEEKRYQVDEELSYRSQSTVVKQEPGSPEFYSLNES